MPRPITLATAAPIATLLAALAIGWSSPAHAQINPFKGKGPRLEPSDTALMDRAASPLFQADTIKPGASNTWSNPATGNSGAVTIKGERQVQTMLCRNVQYDITVKARPGARTYLVDWCRTQDGTWKMR